MTSLEDFGVSKYEGVLNNGTRIFHYFRKNSPISTAVLFDAGSGNDPVGKEGLAHFAEHMLFKGTKRFKDETEAGLFLESIGGHANAFTGVDYLGITADVSFSSDFNKTVDFIYELTRESLFEDEKIEIERGTILGEIADYESNPALYIGDLSQSLIYQNTYAQRSIAGSKETVLSITREDLFSFYNSKIVNGEMVIVVSGDIDFDYMKKLFNDRFGDKKPKSLITVEKPEIEIVRKKLVDIKKYEGIDQIFMSFSYRASKYIDEDTDIFFILKIIIGDGFSSSLFRKLRTENGLVYSLDVQSEPSPDRGLFSVLTSTSKDKVQKVLDVLTDEFKRLERGDISKEELRLAKDKIIKSKITEMQTSTMWVGFHLPEVYLNPKNPMDLSDWLRKIEEISLDGVKEVAKKYFSKDKWYLAMCGDIEEKDFIFNY